MLEFIIVIQLVYVAPTAYVRAIKIGGLAAETDLSRSVALGLRSSCN